MSEHAPRRAKSRKTLFEMNPELATKEAKKLYFEYVPKAKITKLTGLPETTLNHLVQADERRGWLGWYQERNGIESETLAKAFLSNSDELKQVCGLTTDILRKQLLKWIAREDELTAKELKLVSDIQANIDRIFRLENKKPTSITEERQLTPSNVRDEMRRMYEELTQLDPMVDYGESDKGSKVH